MGVIETKKVLESIKRLTVTGCSGHRQNLQLISHDCGLTLVGTKISFRA